MAKLSVVTRITIHTFSQGCQSRHSRWRRQLQRALDIAQSLSLSSRALGQNTEQCLQQTVKNCQLLSSLPRNLTGLNAYTVISHLHEERGTPNESNLGSFEEMQWNHRVLSPEHLDGNECRSKDGKPNSESSQKANVLLRRVNILEHLNKYHEAENSAAEREDSRNIKRWTWGLGSLCFLDVAFFIA